MSDKKELYLHVGNSGVNFDLETTKYGPELKISTSSFGNLNTTLSILTNKTSLIELAELIKSFADNLDDNHKEYVYPARSLTNIETDSGVESSEVPLKDVN